MKRDKKNVLKHYTIAILFFCTLLSQPAWAEEKQEFQIKDLIFEHLEDAYKWYFFTWKETDVSLYLPVIVQSPRGEWVVFSSSHLEKGKIYKGFYIAQEGNYKHKIVTTNSAGEEIRPWDFSITKNVLAIFISIGIMLTSFLALARWYKKDRLQPPGGFLGMLEIVILSIQDEVIKPSIGKEYERYAPFLLTTFFFVLINNLMGLIPLFPGGANVTGNITITFFLSLIVFLLININGNKHYWKEIFWPDTPTWLKFPVPLMPIIELWSVLMKPAALMVRLFANIMAGHSMTLGLISLIFISAAMGPAANAGLSVASILFSTFIGFIELLISVIQAYVFVLLSSVFIGMSRQKAEDSEEENSES
ncbi:MAG: F0F1 ATP synthase subunit A [Massilibacteroides sp.]|nr:F0F1 ATP synthase subunit A [Massilibacteroides sp.]MDD3063658.1 F0F1 ATP synthase subunit A [Massilibacteroides sp.]MDD4114792.1 F0F1 ATP synthase subunit A [Massilibacteroides sp.]MDD4661197.1 F0F1 ATP synthase subunit A [Massilibacteroides sp.]